jgi:hypothetical protein
MKVLRTLVFTSLGVSSALALALAGEGCGSTASTTPPGGSGTGSGSEHPGSSTGSGSAHPGSGSAPSSGSGSSHPTSGTGSGAAVGMGGPDDAGGPPNPPPTNPTASTAKHNFAIHNLYIGDSDPTPAFTADTNAWETFGYNLDGLLTTASSTDVCTPTVAGGYLGNEQQIDGTNGVDNTFGNVVVDGLLGSLFTSSSVTGDITDGKFTLELDTTGLDGTASQTATGLAGAIYAGGNYGSSPPQTGTSWSADASWPVNGSLLTNGDAAPSATNPSTIVFPNAYVVNGTYVTGTPTNVKLSLAIEGQNLTLTIHGATITMPTTETSGQFHATGAKIAGALLLSELLPALGQVGGALGACPVVQDFAPTIASAADLVVDSAGDVTNPVGKCGENNS